MDKLTLKEAVEIAKSLCSFQGESILWDVVPKRKEALQTLIDNVVKKVDRPKIVCLCGSSRFVKEMACIAWALERDEGIITFGLHLLPANYPNVFPDHMAEHEGKKEQLDNLHKKKIDLSDEILVINIGGYIGESTKSEIEYTLAHNKPVRYLEKI